MQYTLNLKAGVTIRQGTPGSFFLLQDTGVASSIDIVFRVHSQVAEHITIARRGLKAALHGGQRFTSIEFTSSVDTAIQIIISDGVVDISQLDGANVNATIVGQPVLTSNDRGSPGSPIFISGTIPGTSPAALVVDDAPVAVTAAVTAVVAANTNRVSIRFTNTGASPVALGSGTLTWAKAALILNPGDTWVEERAANLAWSGICNTGLSTSLGVQEITV